MDFPLIKNSHYFAVRNPQHKKFNIRSASQMSFPIA